MLITLEGIDGSGKTTVWEALQQELSSDEIVFTREPTDSQYGKLLRENLAKDTENTFTELFLFMADHACHVMDTVNPAIDRGEVVICDRYIDSRCAYQGYTLNDEMEKPVEFVYSMHEEWSRIPDLTILIDVSPKTSIERLNTDEKFETEEKLTAIQENYAAIAEMDENRFQVVDGEQDKNKVLEDVMNIITGEIGENENEY